MTNYLSFDIETAKVLPADADPGDHRPLGICCWAIAWQTDEGTFARSFCGKDDNGNIRPQMSRLDCIAMIYALMELTSHDQGMLVTHNGVGFDLDIAAEESGLLLKCANLAMNSVDTCLLVHCLKGFPVGLDAIAKGMNLQGKVEGMSGALAPQLWADGKYDEVLAYVAQDARSTLEVALAIEQRKGLEWIAKSGRRNKMPIRRLLTVKECLELPLPDNSWMRDPMPRSKFVGWMEPRSEPA